MNLIRFGSGRSLPGTMRERQLRARTWWKSAKRWREAPTVTIKEALKPPAKAENGSWHDRLCGPFDDVCWIGQRHGSPITEPRISPGKARLDEPARLAFDRCYCNLRAV